MLEDYPVKFERESLFFTLDVLFYKNEFIKFLILFLVWYSFKHQILKKIFLHISPRD